MPVKGATLIGMGLLVLGAVAAQAVENSDYAAVPAFISNEVKPNILFIIDNSNSMDEDVDGAAVGGASPLSKSEIARKAVMQIIDDQRGNMRFGLMAYRQTNVVSHYIHNSFYYCSYDSATYDPAGTPTPKDPTTNTKRFPNPTAPGEYIYYDTALPFYSNSSAGNAFCYSRNFNYAENGASHSYWCYHDKTGDNSTPMGLNQSSLGSYGYSDNFMNTSFFPTDSDIAAGFSKFGYEMSWVPVSPTWFSNTSPGGGILHNNIADSSDAHIDAIKAKLATSQFTTATDIPLRNAGLTPIEGTIDSAKKYFMGNAVATASGITATNPITLQCQKNYVILLTDGLPSTDKNGNTGDTDDLLEAVKASITSLRNTQNVNFPAEFDVQTYVIGFAIPEELGSKLDELAIAGGTDIDGKALLANNATELAQKLKALMLDISKKVASGTAASVVAKGRTGEGVVYQSVFHPEFSDKMTPSHSVSWVGSLNSLFIDSYGNLREDTDGNKQYEIDKDCLVVYRYSGATVMARKYLDSNENNILDINEDLNGNGVLDLAINEDNNGNGILDAGEDLNGNNLLDLELSEDRNGNELLDKHEDANNNGVLDPGEDLNGDGLLYVEDEFVDEVALGDLNYVWESDDWLNEIAGADIVAQRAYDNVVERRYIFTFVDKDGDKIVDAGEQIDFTDAEYDKLKDHLIVYPTLADEPPWLAPIRAAGDYDEYMELASKRIINYIRGEDQGEFTATIPAYTFPAMRSRQVDYDNDGTVETWRLGDIIHSSPVAVGAPSEALHLLYGDTSYADFAKKYSKRRTVVYVGGNDGMIHAFNAGFYDPKEHKVSKTSVGRAEPFIDANSNGIWDTGEYFTDRNYNGVYDDGKGNEKEYAIGSELWAYIPYNLLPHLRFLTSPDYEHMYYNDLTPKVFDAKIFTPEPTCSGADGALSDGCIHPHGWGTVLVTGMRFGGGLYPKSRTWDFVDADLGWSFSPAGNLSGTFVDNKDWLITANTASDTSLLSPVVEVDAGAISSIEIRFSGSATGPGASGATLYWNTTGGDGSWNSMPEQVSSPSVNGLAGYYTYTFNVADNVEWSGTIKRLRIALDTPFSSGDEVAVDYIDIGGGEDYTSSYCLFDITDPETPPVAMAELNGPGLGFTTGMPTVIPIKKVGDDTVNHWYLAFGSGPNHNQQADKVALQDATSNTKGKIYVASLRDIAQSQLLVMLDGSGNLKEGTHVFSKFDENTIVSDLITVDQDLDYDADVAYFGTISGNTTAGWGGKMRRLLFNDGDQDTTQWTGDSTLFTADPGQTITAAASVGIDDNDDFWVYFGTGRYFIRDDASITDSQSYYGIKEDTTTWAEASIGDLLDTTDAEVYDNQEVLGLSLISNWTDLLGEINTRRGWKIQLETTGERNLSQAALLGGIVTFATYTPSTDPCSKGGVSDGYALYYKTGTAYYDPVLGYTHHDRNGDGIIDPGEKKMIKKFRIGRGLASSPAVHTGGDGGSNVVFQASDGSIHSIEENNPGLTKSKKTGWKSLSN